MGTLFAYAAWGRMTSKTRGNYSATYAWGEGDKLTGVASSFPGEGSVTYAYGGDGKRRERNNGSLTKYRWDRGWTVLHEENGSGGLTLSLVPGRADIAGSNPATGTIRCTLTDHLGSLRALYAPDKTRLGRQEYTPYGTDYLQTGARATRAYTGHDRDAVTGLYFAPYRYYTVWSSRWMSRDPLGIRTGPNLYAYVNADPVNLEDPLGLWATEDHGHYAGLDKDMCRNAFVQPWLHFRSRDRVEDKLTQAIENCNFRKFKRLMHQGQDSFSHYDPGYRWYTLGHVPQSLACKCKGQPDPDDRDAHNAQYDAMLVWTGVWEGVWREGCGPLPWEGD